MKLTGHLKERVDQAAGREEKRSLIEQAGMELTDDELDQVSGGGGPERNDFKVELMSSRPGEDCQWNPFKKEN